MATLNTHSNSPSKAHSIQRNICPNIMGLFYHLLSLLMLFDPIWEQLDPWIQCDVLCGKVLLDSGDAHASCCSIAAATLGNNLGDQEKS